MMTKKDEGHEAFVAGRRAQFGIEPRQDVEERGQPESG